MAKTITLADIAKRVGVSTVTVSKALSGQKGVSEAMRKKIIEIADDLGYHRQERMKRVSAEPRSYNIGVLISDFYLGKYETFYSLFYQQVAAAALARGSFVLMEGISSEEEKECHVPKLVAERKVDGVIVIGKLSEAYLAMLHKKKALPIVYLDFSTNDSTADAVISNSYYGEYCVTNYLFEHGHRKIGFVGTVLATESITDRYLGYTKSLMEHGGKPEDIIIVPDRDIETGKMYPELEMEFPDKKHMPTAFVCNCDLTASYVVRRLRHDGYRVPEDISVCGYDNYLFPGLCDIPLTTYEVDMKEMAKKAVSIVVHKIEGRPYHAGLSIVEGSLIERESVKTI